MKYPGNWKLKGQGK